MSEQKQFDFPRAAKLNALERVRVGTSVKSLLKALDGFIRDKDRDSITLKRISQSMDCSTKTAQRAVRTAERAGLVTVWGDPSDGQANVYRIEWGVIFDLPDAPAKPVRRPSTPGQIDRGPRTKCPPTPDKLTGDPGQNDRGATPPTKNDKETATIRQPERGHGGGGGISKLTTDNRQPSTTRPSGFWAWSVTRCELSKPATVLSLFKAATEAGYLTGLQLDQIRFLALVNRIRTDEEIRNVTGYLVATVQTGSWNYLPVDAIRKAWSQVRPGQPPPTSEQIARVKSPTFKPQTVTN